MKIVSMPDRYTDRHTRQESRKWRSFLGYIFHQMYIIWLNLKIRGLHANETKPVAPGISLTAQ